MILKSETDGHMGPEELDPRKSTCSLPTDTSQPSEWPLARWMWCMTETRIEQHGRKSVNARFTDKYDKSMLLSLQISPTISLHLCRGMDVMASTRWV